MLSLIKQSVWQLSGSATKNIQNKYTGLSQTNSKIPAQKVKPDTFQRSQLRFGTSSRITYKKVVDILDGLHLQQGDICFVTDMDGFLYQYIPEPGIANQNPNKINDFYHSAASNELFERSTNYLIEKGIKKEAAIEIVTRGFRIGTFLQIVTQAFKDANIEFNPEDFLNNTWGRIDVKKAIPKECFGPATAYIKTLSQKPHVKLLLLTAAPSVWMNKVLSRIGLDSHVFKGCIALRDIPPKENLNKSTLLDELYRRAEVANMDPKNNLRAMGDREGDVQHLQDKGCRVWINNQQSHFKNPTQSGFNLKDLSK